jgi:hypothetical protein
MRPTAGHLLGQAEAQLRLACDAMPPAAGIPEIGAVASGLHRVVVTLQRCIADIFPAGTPASRRAATQSWAAMTARLALAEAAGRLEAAAELATSRASPAAGVTRRLDAAGRAAMAARDLMQTHFGPPVKDGTRGACISEWGPVVSSEPVGRAVLAHAAACSRDLAAVAALVVQRAVAAQRTAAPCGLLDQARECLWAAEESLHAANLRCPATPSDHALLDAIPVCFIPEPVALTGTETVREVAAAVITTATRVRQALWREALLAAPPSAQSPALSAASLRHTAASATVISYTCGAALAALRTRTGQLCMREASWALAESLPDAGAVNAGWLGAARVLAPLHSDSWGAKTTAAQAAADLAGWTGRLAYRDPGWRPESGRGAGIRAGEDLAADRGDVAAVAAALHHVAHTLACLAPAEAGHAKMLAAAGRLYTPARALPHADSCCARERVLRQLGAGLTVEQIAARAGVAAVTVRRLAASATVVVPPSTAEKLTGVSVGKHSSDGRSLALIYLPAAAEQVRPVLDAYRAVAAAGRRLAAGMDVAAQAARAPTAVLTAARRAARPAAEPAAAIKVAAAGRAGRPGRRGGPGRRGAETLAVRTRHRQ